MSHILLIEPDTVLARSYQLILKKDGHSVDWCQKAEKAIQQADRRRPDLVLMELQLAGHNGIEFLYEFRSYPDWLKIPVIVNTQLPPDNPGLSAAAWEQLEISDYHYKPQTKLQEVLSSVNRVLSATLSP